MPTENSKTTRRNNIKNQVNIFDAFASEEEVKDTSLSLKKSNIDITKKEMLDMEKEMPFQCFTAEQQVCTDEKRKNFTSIEQYIPYAMIGVFVVLLLSKYWDWLMYFMCWCA